MNLLNETPITAERGCKCGHLERQHNPANNLCTVDGCTLCRPYLGNDNKGFEFNGYRPEASVTTEEHHGFTETRERHPSYGQIGANRVRGGVFLYGSDFRHQHYINLQIYESENIRELSGDRHHARRRIISVVMSEAQWATFVSSLNQGGGVPCTIEYTMEHGQIPPIAMPKDRRTQFSAEMQEHFDLAQRSIDEAEAEIDDLPLSGVKKKALKDKLRTARANIGDNTDFVAERFDEHMEKAVEKAKSEVNAYAQHLLVNLATEASPIKFLEAAEVSP